jgi:VanZ family protein
MNYRLFFAAAAIVLTVGLFVVGGRPEAGQIFKGNWHWVAHLFSYALIALAYALALPGFGWLYVAAMVAMIGGIHEFYEIQAHGHDFETADLLVNATGALLGSLLRRAFPAAATGNEKY